MKKGLLIFGIIILAILFGLALVKGLSGEDDWLCQNGQWVKHGKPSSSAPTTGCGIAKKLVKPEIKIDAPSIDEKISSPFNISGEAIGNWYFEASFPIQLVDESGKILVQTNGQANGDWMTTDFVPFTSQLIFNPGEAKSGKIIFKNDNPSGNSESQKIYELSVTF